MTIKKKRFGLSTSLSQGLTEAVNIAEAAPGIFHSTLLPISRVDLDPNNPRRLAISRDEVLYGIDEHDTNKNTKLSELESLKELSHTIKNSGMLNPIIVFKNADRFQVVAGERRYLATQLAGITEIEARVYHEKPKGFELKLIQWVENTAREDLSLIDRINNIKEIIAEYEIESNESVNATKLKEFTGLSLSQCTKYMNVLEGDAEVIKLIEKGLLQLDKAVVLTNIKDSAQRKKAIDAFSKGANLNELRLLANEKNIAVKNKNEMPKIKKRGVQPKKVVLGSTKNKSAIEQLVKVILESQRFIRYRERFKNIDWNDYSETSFAFKELLKILETYTPEVSDV